MALSDHDIIRVSGEYDPESVREISLDNMQLISISAITKCVGLRSISLANNMLHDLRAVASLAELTSINATGNRISTLEDIKNLKNLRVLRVAGNALPQDFSELLQQLRPFRNLEELEISTPTFPYQGWFARYCAYARLVVTAGQRYFPR
mgnify:CR=1 FL=1